MVLTPQRVAVAHAGVVQGLMLVGMDCGSLAALDMSVSVRPTCREVERQMNKAPMVSVTWLGDHLKRVESAIILNPTNLIRRNGRGRPLAGSLLRALFSPFIPIEVELARHEADAVQCLALLDRKCTLARLRICALGPRWRRRWHVPLTRGIGEEGGPTCRLRLV